MTLGLYQWWRLLGISGPGSVSGRRRRMARLDLSRLSSRDIADLNLPHEVLTKLGASQAEADRRRGYR